MIYSRSTLGRVVGALGFCIGLTVAVGGPAGYLLAAYSEVDHELALLAELKATRLAKYIYTHADLWQYNTLRLAELTDVLEASETIAQQRIFDAAGKLVLETGERPEAPVVRWSTPVVVGGVQVARVETATTLAPILIKAVLVACLSSLLGLAIFFLIRILPMRIIDRTLAELEATQARYRLLFDVNPFPMAVLDAATRRFLAINDAGLEKYGYTREEFLAMTAEELYLPEDLPAVQALRAKPGEPRTVRTLTGLRHRKKDGALIEVEISVRPFLFDGVSSLLLMSQDVTERNRAEKGRLLAEDKLRQSQKMEAVGQLTGGIAHDFNNLLMVIMANVEALQEEVDLGPELTTRLEGIDRAIGRASGLTRQLLAFSRKQALRAQVTDVNTLVAGTVKLLTRSLGSNIEIETVNADGLWPVDIDRTQLETALLNLSVNARDAMPSGGRLVIETRNATLDKADVVRHPDVAVGDYVVLSVTDTGTGMPPEVVAKVFEPFFTTKELGKGTGLGLSMVYGFIKQSHGHLEVDSAPGKGTCFRLYLPRTAEVLQLAVPAKKAALPRGCERILVVEDEPSVRANTVMLLKGLGYDVEQAEDGAAGLATFEAAAHPFDLLLTDIVMPRLDGKGLAAAVSLRWPATRVVFMSGYTEGANGIDLDPDIRLLSKPFRGAELARAIREAFAAPAGAGSPQKLLNFVIG